LLFALLGVLSAGPFAAAAADVPAGLDGRFRGALKSAWAGDLDTAWGELSSLWEQVGVRRPTLAYDLGALALARGEPARAVYYFRVAELLGPSSDLSEEIAAGLARTRAHLTRDAERDVHRQHLVHGRVTGLAYGALHRVSEPSLAWSSVALAAAFAGLFAWKRGRAGVGARASLVAVALGLLLALGAWAGRVHQDTTIALGVVVQPEATLREALDPAAPTHAVPGGTEVLVLEERDGDHLRVKLPTGRKGWLPRVTIGRL
jgi:hypothetical protein